MVPAAVAVPVRVTVAVAEAAPAGSGTATHQSSAVGSFARYVSTMSHSIDPAPKSAAAWSAPHTRPGVFLVAEEARRSRRCQVAGRRRVKFCPEKRNPEIGRDAIKRDGHGLTPPPSRGRRLAPSTVRGPAARAPPARYETRPRRGRPGPGSRRDSRRGAWSDGRSYSGRPPGRGRRRQTTRSRTCPE